MKKITDFLKTTATQAELSAALKVILEFRSGESEDAWLNVPFIAWSKLEQLEEFLEFLVNGKDLRKDTVDYMNKATDSLDKRTRDGMQDLMSEKGFKIHNEARRKLNETMKKLRGEKGSEEAYDDGLNEIRRQLNETMEKLMGEKDSEDSEDKEN